MGVIVVEVRVSVDYDVCMVVWFLVQDEGGVFGFIFVVVLGVEGGVVEVGVFDGFKELFGDDGVSVNVGFVQGCGDVFEVQEFGQVSIVGGVSGSGSRGVGVRF